MPSPVRFAQEELTEGLWSELLPLLHEHWKEIAHYPDIQLNPDRAMYANAQANGMLRFFTAREEWPDRTRVIRDGETTVCPTVHLPLVGYAVFFVRSNPHYVDSLQAVQDVLFLQPPQRGATGSRFIDWCDIQLQHEGVQAVYHHVKAAHNFGPMLERKGYDLVDLIYAKRLDQ